MAQGLIKYRYWYGGKMLKVGQIEFLVGGGLIVNGELVGGVLLEGTGLVDKNGKDIYEGDIIRYKSDKMSAKPRLIEWISMMNCTGFNITEHQRRQGYPPVANQEIIGNVFENPELLDKKINV